MEFVQAIERWCKMSKMLKGMKRVCPVVDPNGGTFVMHNALTVTINGCINEQTIYSLPRPPKPSLKPMFTGREPLTE